MKTYEMWRGTEPGKGPVVRVIHVKQLREKQARDFFAPGTTRLTNLESLCL